MRRASPTGTGSGIGTRHRADDLMEAEEGVERETTKTRRTPRDRVTCGA
ncbi:hypothetical protein [Streptomyces virginiae]|uniref:Uncharacterized protein n=1 Tax=Streptomyces virginiae TaxID=1961 RepID=A0ABZ1TLZ8_STRVG|nr:hypothetical protein [Streptomyces virginiae]WTB26443.1 hypothetical protein OG253_35905 [Streptomyces virginiae]